MMPVCARGLGVSLQLRKDQGMLREEKKGLVIESVSSQEIMESQNILDGKESHKNN